MIQDPVFWGALLFASIAFWLLPAAYRRLFLAGFSVIMLGYYNLVSCAFLLFYSAGLYLCLPAIARRAWYSTPILLANMAVMLVPLILFKSAVAYLADPSKTIVNAGDVLVPIGMSYYVFRMLHVAIDAYRRRAFNHSFSEYSSYAFLFTILAAGPIQRIDEFVGQSSNRWESDHILNGLTRIAYGLIKQTFVIDAVFGLRNALVSAPLPGLSLAVLGQLPYSDLWLVLVAGYVTGYLNLSAYTDIAIGSSRLFGFKIAENFRLPVVARNLSDFWRRWHMTLSSWCQSYVYSQALGWWRNPYVALILSFQVMGLWHFFTLNRMGWGLFHAVGIIGVVTWGKLSRRWGVAMENSMPGKCAAWATTQAYVSASWVFVIAERSNDFFGSLRILARLVLIA